MNFIEISNAVFKFTKSLRTEDIALFSIVVSILIYSLGKRNEILLKKHESKRENYIKFLELHIDIFRNIKEKKEFKNNQLNKKFFQVGSSLLTYGSKKLYKQYIFYREITTNPIIDSSKYYKNEMNLYLLGGILRQIRKELSFEKITNINENEALSFFVNGFTNNPISKKKLAEMKYRIKMVKIEMFFADRYSFVWLNNFYYVAIKQVIGIIEILFRFFVKIPFGKIIMRNEKMHNWLERKSKNK